MIVDGDSGGWFRRSTIDGGEGSRKRWVEVGQLWRRWTVASGHVVGGEWLPLNWAAWLGQLGLRWANQGWLHTILGRIRVVDWADFGSMNWADLGQLLDWVTQESNVRVWHVWSMRVQRMRMARICCGAWGTFVGELNLEVACDGACVGVPWGALFGSADWHHFCLFLEAVYSDSAFKVAGGSWSAWTAKTSSSGVWGCL